MRLLLLLSSAVLAVAGTVSMEGDVSMSVLDVPSVSGGVSGSCVEGALVDDADNGRLLFCTSSGWNVLQRATCGNGELDDDEECDDGNTQDGDGCSATCTIVPGMACSTSGCVSIGAPLLWNRADTQTDGSLTSWVQHPGATGPAWTYAQVGGSTQAPVVQGGFLDNKCVDFGGNSLMDSATNVNFHTQAFSTYAVVHMNEVPNGQRFFLTASERAWSGTANLEIGVSVSAVGEVAVHDFAEFGVRSSTSGAAYPADSTSSGIFLVSYHYTGSGWQLFTGSPGSPIVNHPVVGATSTFAPGTPVSLRINLGARRDSAGGQNAAPDGRFDGCIYELIHYPSYSDSTQQQNIHDYLYEKYGMDLE